LHKQADLHRKHKYLQGYKTCRKHKHSEAI